MSAAPEAFDLFVIGGGSAGVRAARFAASFGARVAIAESRYLGGTCVNVGCVPKKLLVYGARYANEFAHAAGYGWSMADLKFDWPTLIANKNHEIQRLNGIYRELLVSSGVTIMDAHAQLLDAHTVQVDGRSYRANYIMIATGGWPQKPEIPGVEHAITSNEVFFLKALPQRMVVIGGGYIALEFASIFHGLGARTTQLYRGDLFLRGFDQEVRTHLRDELSAKGLDLRFNAEVTRIDKQPDGVLRLTLKDQSSLDADCVLYATGRRPMLDNLGLQNTNIQLDARGFVSVDAMYQTAEPSIYAIGDVIGQAQLTPVALAHGMAVARHLFKPELYRPVKDHLIPSTVFSLPNVATVGLSEEQALACGYQVRIFQSRFRPLQNVLTDSKEKILIKLVVDAQSDRVLGCHMVGPDAGEIIQGLAIAMQAGATKQIFDDTIGIHPTIAEEFVTLRTATR